MRLGILEFIAACASVGVSPSADVAGDAAQTYLVLRKGRGA